MRIRFALALAALGLTAIAAFGQPSDAQIIKDLTKPGVLKVELSPGPTKKEWHSAQGQYMWDRVAYVTRGAEVAEYPKATVRITGIARYHYGASTSFREFKVAENEYFGLPAPNKEEMLGMIRERYLDFLGHRARSMVGDLHYMRIPEGEGVIWHTPLSFTIPVEIAYDSKTSNIHLTTIQEKVDTRFYRDAVSTPWKENIVAVGRDRTEGAQRTFPADDLRAMPTFRDQLEEQQAQRDLAALGDVTIPEFKSDMDVFLYTHKLLRESNAKQLEAYLMRMLAPSYYVEGSTTRLTPQGADVINKAVAAAFGGKGTYAEQYCADPGVKHQQPDMIEIWNATQDAHTRMHVGRFGGGWKNGQKVGEQYKFIALEVWMLTSADDIARLRSYEPGMLCEPASAGAKATGGATTTTPATTTSGTGSPQSAGSDLIKKGKGLLNKLTTP
ncbi:MAG TPA: hypothetical protein PKJ19_00335 [Flavobacteriales bacterium]|nr:hypothetical protein [Flavobacteriales bacterium]